MSHSREQVEDLFHQACEVAPASRHAFLIEACAGNEPLLREVKSLLHSLESDVTKVIAFVASDAMSDAAAPERLPEQLGEFQIVRLLGEGGMGRVYEAKQESPARSVALKVIRAGVFSRSLIARFRREANVLAQLKHPGIAQVLQVGSLTLPDGDSQPYFAMELVSGESITDYADAKQFDPRARLALIAKVCDAVQHAHQRGVIHRDLKPANVLVEDSATTSDDDITSISHVGQPKVLDFGIARLLSANAETDAPVSMQTEAGQIIGTLAYMSPEQASGDSRAIDTRADVYALGAMAYQLLAGRVPIEVGGKPIALAVRAIQEQSPANLGSLDPALRGDVEIIIAKALAKDPDRRYASAGELGADIRRLLRDQPIVARPPSTMYVLRKFSRRHRMPLAGAAAAFLGVAGSLAYGFASTRAQRDRAVLAEQQTAARAADLQKVSDFQAQMLAQVNPAHAGVLLSQDVAARFDVALAKAGIPETERAAQTQEFTARWKQVNATDAARELINQTILKPAVVAIDKDFAKQPLVDATLRLVIGSRYADLGMCQEGLALAEQSLEIRRRELGDDHPDTLFAMKSAANILQASGKFAEAEPALREVLEKSRRVLGEDHEQTLYAISSLAVALLELGRFDEAEQLERTAVEKGRRVLGENHPELPMLIGNLASAIERQGRAPESEPFAREALEKSRRALGDEHLFTLGFITNYGNLMSTLGRYDEAKRIFQESVEKNRRALGEEHPNTLLAMSQLGQALQRLGELEEAERLLRDSLSARRRVLGNDDRETLASIGMLGDFLQRHGSPDEAEALLRESIDGSKRILGPDHPETLTAMSNMAVLLLNLNKLQEAEELARETLEGRERALGADRPATLVSLNVLATVHTRQKKFDLAERYLSQALETARRILPQDHPDLVIYLNNLGNVLKEQGKLNEAEALMREASTLAERVLGASHPSTLVVKHRFGGVLVDLGRFDEALTILTSIEGPAQDAYRDSAPRQLASFYTKMGIAHAGMQHRNEAQEKLLESRRLLLAAPDANPDDMRKCVQALVDLYAAWDAAEPGKGHDASRQEWAEKAKELEAPVSEAR